MKYVLTLFAAFLFLSNSFGQLPKGDNLGLISELVANKTIVETYASIALEDTGYRNNKSDFKDMVHGYDAVRILMNQFILQLEADCTRRNGLRSFKELDLALADEPIDDINPAAHTWGKSPAYFKTLQQINSYLKAMRTAFLKHYNRDNTKPGTLKVGFADLDITAIATLAHDAIRGAADARQKKVAQLCAMLDALRIVPITELAVKKADDK